jgi:hypothetical protein
MIRRVRLTLTIALAVTAAFAPAARAATEAEPNDNITQPNGPMAPGAVYEGSFQRAGDHDRFVLYATGSGNVDVTVTNLGGSCESKSMNARVLNADGVRVSERSVRSVDALPTHIPLTPAGPTRYYVLLDDDCAGAKYTLQAGPAGAVTPNSPAAAFGQPGPNPVPAPEPNDTLVGAFGPLAGDVAYGGRLDTTGDADWYVVYTQPGQPLDVALTKVGGGCSTTLDAKLLDADGESERGTRANSDETSHMVFPPAALPARHYVSVFHDCAGNDYQLRVGPGPAITTSSPLLGTQPRLQAQPLREPDDRLDGATGPLQADTGYAGDFGSVTDIDHAYFYTAAPGPIDVAVAKVGRGCSSSISTRLLDPAGSVLDSIGPANDRIGHMNVTAPRAGLYVVRATSGCAGDPYQLRVSAPSGLSAAPPPVFVVAPRRDRKPPFTFAVSGNLVGRLGPAQAVICRGGRAILRLQVPRKKKKAKKAKRGARKAAAGARKPARKRKARKPKMKTVLKREATLLPDCSYQATLTVRRRKTFGKSRRTATLVVTFAGRPELERMKAMKAKLRLR